MKILLVNDYGVLAGGAERITVDLRDGLRARGHDARLLSSTASARGLPNVADYTCAGTNGPARLLLQTWNPWARRRVRQVLKEFQPDVVHVRMFLTQLSASILSLLETAPSLLHVGNHQTICPLNTRILPDHSRCTERAGVPCYQHGCVSALGLGRTLAQLGMVRRHLQAFRLIVANSQALADTLRENGVPVHSVIPNGTRCTPQRPPLAKPPTVVFAGRLVAQKGVDLLLHAMSIVVEQVPDTRLSIMGEGPERGRLESLVAELRLQSHVTFGGHVAHLELGTRLASGWVHVVPSRSPEPGANVIPEAMMRGTAVVATRFDGAPEGIREGTTGFLVAPFDAAALAERLILLLRDRELAERMGRAGREVALSDLTTDRMIDGFESAYATLG